MKIFILLLLVSSQSYASPAQYMRDEGKRIVNDSERSTQEYQNQIEANKQREMEREYYQPTKQFSSF